MSNAIDPPTAGNAENVTAPAADPLPEKFQGKEAADIAKAYAELEKMTGSQAQEIGQLRQALNQATTANAPPAEEADFYTDPEAAIKQTVQPLVQAIAELRVENMRQKLAVQHPNYEKTLNELPFQEWVADSPVRLQLWNQANVGDYASANELFSTWTTVNQTKTQAEQQTSAAVKRDRKLRAATVEQGSATIPAGKTIRNQDLIELRRTNPEKYRANWPEIEKAYREGRVTRD